LISGLPRKTDTLLNRLEQGKLEVQNTGYQPQDCPSRARRARFDGGGHISGLLMASTQMYLAQDVTAAIILGLLPFWRWCLLCFPGEQPLYSFA